MFSPAASSPFATSNSPIGSFSAAQGFWNPSVLPPPSMPVQHQFPTSTNQMQMESHLLYPTAFNSAPSAVTWDSLKSQSGNAASGVSTLPAPPSHKNNSLRLGLFASASAATAETGAAAFGSSSGGQNSKLAASSGGGSASKLKGSHTKHRSAAKS